MASYWLSYKMGPFRKGAYSKKEEFLPRELILPFLKPTQTGKGGKNGSDKVTSPANVSISPNAFLYKSYFCVCACYERSYLYLIRISKHSPMHSTQAILTSSDFSADSDLSRGGASVTVGGEPGMTSTWEDRGKESSWKYGHTNKTTT